MSAPRQHSIARRIGPSRLVGLTAALLLSAGLGACTAPSPPSAAPTTESVALPLQEGDLDAGTYLFDGFAVPFEVTVPDGWTYVMDRVLRKDVGDTEGAFVWFGQATHVPTDACDWSGTITEVAPSVRAFADSLSAQASTITTVPTEVTVGDYKGLEFDFSVEGVSALQDCDGNKICIHSESLSCTRWYNSSVAQRETYRVLDLDGERAVLSFGEFDDQTDAGLIAEARAVFDSITFVKDD